LQDPSLKLMRSLTLLFLFLLASFTLRAQLTDAEHARQKFIHYVEPIGFVLIEGIEPGMTLYSLSRKYNVGIDTILAANPDLDPKAIPLGYPVNVPIYAKAISPQNPALPLNSLQGTSLDSSNPGDNFKDEGIPLYYRVQPKETLYRISKTYLDVSPESILALNPLATSNLAIGQVLLLGWYHAQNNTHSPVSASTSMIMDTTLYKVKDYAEEYKTEGKVFKEEKGLAVWKPGNDKTHYFVLHPTAIVGSYMEITNPMLHRTLTAKVAGNIPPGLYQPHVGLVVSPSVARALGVLDQQFFAKWRFVE
jgi:LysM repeat protein